MEAISGWWASCEIRVKIGPAETDFHPVPVRVTCECGCDETGELPAVTENAGTVAANKAMRNVVSGILERHHGKGERT